MCNKSIWAEGMGEQGREHFIKSLRSKPQIQPESCHSSIIKDNLGFVPKGWELGVDILPDRSHRRNIIAKIRVLIPAISISQPINPRSRRSTMKLEKELFKEACIFLAKFGTPRPPFSFGRVTSSQATLQG